MPNFRVVWAYKPIEALKGETGFVNIDEDLARQLIESGEVQDPHVGYRELKYIETLPRNESKKKKPKPDHALDLLKGMTDEIP